MEIASKVTRPQLDRNNTAARMSSTAWFVNGLMCALEIAAWYKYGGNSPLAQGFFVAMAVASIVIRPALTSTQIIYRAEGDSQGINMSSLLLNISIAITIASCLMFFTMHFAELEEESRLGSAPVKKAELHLEAMQKALEMAKQAMAVDGFTDAQRISATQTRDTLQVQLKTAQVRAAQQNKDAIAAYNRKVATFWATKHTSGLSHNQIMSEACVPKKSRYGLMRSAAQDVCPHWQHLQSQSPSAINDPEVQRLQRELGKLQPLLAHDLAIEMSKEALAHADAAYWDAAQNTPANSHQLQFFEMIVGAFNGITGMQLKASHAAALFFTLVVFMFVKGALMIGAMADKAKTVVVRSSDMQSGESERHSVLGQVFGWVGGKYNKPKSNDDMGSAHAATAHNNSQNSPAYGFKFVDTNNKQNQGRQGSQFNTEAFLQILEGLQQGLSYGQLEKSTGINKGSISRYVCNYAKPHGLVEGDAPHLSVDAIRVSRLKEALQQQYSIQDALAMLNA